MHRSPGILFLTLLLGLALFSITAQATRVTVRAVLPNGAGAGPGVDVVVTNNTGYRTSGVTNKQSRVRFSNVPEGNQTITVERSNERGQWQGNVRGKNQNVKVTLTNVSQTIPSAPTAPTAPSAALRINDGADCVIVDGVVLANTVTGPAPKGYRASEDRSLIRTAPWTLYSARPPFTLSAGAGKKTVYFQVQSPVAGTLVDSEIVSYTINRVAPRSSAVFNINNGAATTFNRTVTLNNTASFTPSGPNPRYLASEDPNFAGAQWQAYGTEPQFTLSAGTGSKTVYFMASREVCGRVVATPPVSDTIEIPQITVAAPPATETVIAEPVRPIVPPPVALRSFEFINDRGQSVNPLTPAEVITYAGSQGFRHSASLTRGDGSCSRETNVATDYIDGQVQAWFLARPRWTQDLGSTQVEYLTCEFNLFGSRRLNPGWRVVSVSVGQMEIRPWSGIVQVKALPSADNLNFTIVVPLPGIECGTALFKLCPAALTIINDTFLDTATGIDVKTVDQVAFIKKLVIEGPTNDWHDAFRR